MNILVSNDDGINGEGLITLALMLSGKGHKVTVVAPDGNRSAFSHSLTIRRPFKVVKVENYCVKNAYAVSGSPADCVKFALTEFKNEKFDLVCSGINAGSNIGSEVVYSGTVSCALEANCLGYKSMAFSCAAFKDINFENVGKVCADIFDKFLPFVSDKYALSVNVPNLAPEQIKGVKVTKLGVQLYSDAYEKRGENEYELVGVPLDHDYNLPDCDVEWIKKNYATVTPVLCDKTAYAAITDIKKKLCEDCAERDEDCADKECSLCEKSGAKL